MKSEHLTRLKGLRKPADPSHVEYLIKKLGEAPSIATIEAVLKHYKDLEKKILSHDLLEDMQEEDITNFETDDFKVSINTYVSASIKDQEKALPWLEENQYGDCIKDTLTLPKGELTPEKEEQLQALGLEYVRKMSVAPMTLKKIMSDRLKLGEPLPDMEEGFSVNYYDECKVKEK